MKFSLLGILSLILCSGLSQAKTIDLVLCEDPWPPYTIGEVGDTATEGIAVEFLNTILQGITKAHPDHKFTSQVKLMAWKRCLHSAKVGEVDAVLLLTKNDERSEYLNWTAKVSEDTDLLWYSTRTEKLPKYANLKGWKSYTDLKPFLIATTRGFNYGKEFTEGVKTNGVRTAETGSDKQNFFKLMGGRVDAFVCNKTVANKIFSDTASFRGKFAAAEKPIKKVEFYIGFSKKGDKNHLIPKFNESIKASRAKLDAIMAKGL